MPSTTEAGRNMDASMNLTSARNPEQTMSNIKRPRSHSKVESEIQEHDNRNRLATVKWRANPPDLTETNSASRDDYAEENDEGESSTY